MTQILAVPPDVEKRVVDFLTARLIARGTIASGTGRVGTDVPATWTTSSPTFWQVSLDGTQVEYPVLWRASVRVTLWSNSPTTAKAQAHIAEALLLSAGYLSLAGVITTKDNTSTATLAFFTVRAMLRGTVIA